ncbi:MAG: YncE family protein [Candidatus Sericytochromatia bacterium]|nr:YncE family protein [Candidatus Sericytochromatia bacterium]MEB3221340.1 YncE family protein [Candidatus Sericytochromatia bacterium]
MAPRTLTSDRLRKAWAWGLAALTLGFLSPAPAGHARPAAPDLRGPLVFVSNVFEGTVTIIEPARNRVRKVATGALPHNWSRSPDGREVVVMNTGSESVSFFDGRTGEFKRHMLVAPIPKIPPHEALGPAKFAGKTSCHECHGQANLGRLSAQALYTRDGRSLWTVPFSPPGVVRVDARTGQHLERLEVAPFPFDTQVSSLNYTPDGKELVVLHRRRGKSGLPMEGATGNGTVPVTRFDHDSPPGNRASGITFHTADGRRELGRLIVPLTMPYKVDFSRDGRFMYAAYRSTNKVVEIDVAKRQIARTLVVGEGPHNAVVDKRDGKWLYAPSFYDEPPEVVKVELATGKVRALLPAKVSPAMVAQDPDTGLLYVVANATNRVLELDPRGKGKLLREWGAGMFPLDILVVAESERRAVR